MNKNFKKQNKNKLLLYAALKFWGLFVTAANIRVRLTNTSDVVFCLIMIPVSLKIS